MNTSQNTTRGPQRGLAASARTFNAPKPAPLVTALFTVTRSPLGYNVKQIDKYNRPVGRTQTVLTDFIFADNIHAAAARAYDYRVSAGRAKRLGYSEEALDELTKALEVERACNVRLIHAKRVESTVRDQVAFRVPSLTNPKESYNVFLSEDGKEAECECGAHNFGKAGRCKHAEICREALRELKAVVA